MKIVSVEAVPLNIQLSKVFRFGGVERVTSQNVVVIIRDDDGFVGYGEACPVPHLSGLSQQSIVETIGQKASPVLIGQSHHTYKPLLAQLRKLIIGDPFSLAAIDTALLDLAGKRLGQPISVLLGGPFASRIPVHASVGWDSDADKMADETEALLGQFSHLKIYLGQGELREDLHRLERVRDVAGREVRLMLDINGQWTATETMCALPVLSDLEVASLEQPIAPVDVAGLARVTAISPIAIILDESITSPQDVLAANSQRTGVVANIGISKLGGIDAALGSAGIAEACGLGVVVGSLAETGIANAASLQFAAALPSLAFPSYLTGYHRYASQVTDLLPLSDDGYMQLPEGPGLGVEVDEEAIRAMDAR